MDSSTSAKRPIYYYATLRSILSLLATKLNSGERMNRRWIIKLECDQVAQHLTKALVERGFSISRSFDLQSARDSLRNPTDCSCPNHGTTQCACQYIVLLVRTKSGESIPLIVHGHDDRTILSLGHSLTTEFRDEIIDLMRAVFPTHNPHPIVGD